MNTNKIGIVILNYKVKKEVLGCIKSVQKSTYKNFEIYVVDNNSKDDIKKEVEGIKGVNFTQNTENLGYSGGNNIGIKKAIEQKCDYIFILNPDTKIDSGCISSCLEVSVRYKAGIIAPKILLGDKKTVWYAGGVFDNGMVLGKHRGVDEVDRGQYDTVAETDFATGGAIFISSEVFEGIGFFDERYFLYLEDCDFCYRAKKNGFKIIYNPEALVFHKNAMSSGLGSPLQDYYLTRNRLLYASKFLSLRTRFALIRELLRNFKIRSRRLALKDYLLGCFAKGSI